MKLRNLFEQQPNIIGIPSGIPIEKITLVRPQDQWDAEEKAAHAYNQNGLLGLFTHMSKVFKVTAQELHDEYMSDVPEEKDSEVEAVEDFIDIMYRIPLNAEAGGGGGGGAGGGGGGGAGGGAGSGAGAGSGGGAGPGNSSGGGAHGNSSGMGGSAVSGDTGAADSTPSPAMYVGSMSPYKKSKKKKKKTKKFKFGQGIYEIVRKM